MVNLVTLLSVYEWIKLYSGEKVKNNLNWTLLHARTEKEKKHKDLITSIFILINCNSKKMIEKGLNHKSFN